MGGFPIKRLESGVLTFVHLAWPSPMPPALGILFRYRVRYRVEMLHDAYSLFFENTLDLRFFFSVFFLFPTFYLLSHISTL